MRGQQTGWLLSHGWRRDDGDMVGECTDSTGCIRLGHWTHQFVSGSYCAQHAYHGSNQGVNDVRLRSRS